MMVRMGGNVCGVARFLYQGMRSRALRHVLKIKTGDIALCKAAILIGIARDIWH